MWVLVTTYFGGAYALGLSGVAMQEFTAQHKCVSAAAEINTRLKAWAGDKALAFCVEK